MRRHDREVKNLEGIREILDVCKVCRLGMYDGGEVYIVPMNYGYELDGDKLTLYFHGAREGSWIFSGRILWLVSRWTVCMSWKRGRPPVSTVIIMEVSSEAGEPGSLRNLTRN